MPCEIDLSLAGGLLGNGGPLLPEDLSPLPLVWSLHRAVGMVRLLWECGQLDSYCFTLHAYLSPEWSLGHARGAFQGLFLSPLL